MGGMREVAVIARRAVGHDASSVRPWDGGYVVSARTGEVTVLSHDLAVLAEVTLPGTIGAVAVAPDGQTLAWVADAQLWIGRPDEAVGVSAPTAAAARWRDTALWVVGGTGLDVEVEVRDRAGQVLRSTEFPDMFGDSSLMLFDTAASSQLVVWVAAGQDGQESWLVEDDGTRLSARLLPGEDQIPPAFSADGSWFVGSDDYLTRYSWPAGVELGRLDWPDAMTDDPAGTRLAVLPREHAAWQSENGRLLIVDLATMRFVDEVTISGYPLRTVEDFFPRLAGDRTPMADTQLVVSGAGGMLTRHGAVLALSRAEDWLPASID